MSDVKFQVNSIYTGTMKLSMIITRRTDKSVWYKSEHPTIFGFEVKESRAKIRLFNGVESFRTAGGHGMEVYADHELI